MASESNMAEEPTTAAHKVFGITELLEDILIELPNDDLLLAQRTCKMWRDTIKGSSSIQKALCFKAHVCEAVEKALRGNVPTDWRERIWAMFLLGAQEPSVDITSSAHEFLEKIDGSGPMRLNPLITKLFDNWEEQDNENPELFHPTLGIKEDQDILSADFTGSSLHAMFLTQPPAKSVECVLLRAWRSGKGNEPCLIRNADGVTLGNFVEALRADLDFPGVNVDEFEYALQVHARILC